MRLQSYVFFNRGFVFDLSVLGCEGWKVFFGYMSNRPRLERGCRRIAFVTLIVVFCLIIVRALSQDGASLFSLMKLWQKSRLAYAAIFA